MTMTFKHSITSDQRAFNAVCRHLATQKHRARTRLTDEPISPSAYACQYFTERTGDRCAIGALLTHTSARYAEEHYSGEGITSIAQFIRPFPDISLTLLEQLQTAHDESDDLTQLRFTLSTIAEDFNLNPAAIQSITSWEDTHTNA